MANLLDYLRWRGDLSFAQDSFNDVDCLVLCRLSYLPFEEVVTESLSATPQTLAEACGRVQARVENGAAAVRIKNDVPLMEAVQCAERFSGVRVCGYVNRRDSAQEKQFSAVTFLLPDGIFVAFRGTDGTLVGWKEDFNMSFCAVPAQKDAVAYLEAVAAQYGGPIRLGGHSKGGNLAVYAAAFCSAPVQARIQSVRSNDGPGFTADVLQAPGYDAIASRAHTYVPQSSVVGMLLQHEEAFTVVHSTYAGLAQHDVYSWEVEGKGFLTLESVTSGSMLTDRALKDWLTAMTPAAREKLIDGVYALLSVSDTQTLREMWNGRNTLAIVKSIAEADDETRALVEQALALLGRSVKKNLPAVFEEWTHRAQESTQSLLPEGRLSFPRAESQTKQEGKGKTYELL